MITFGIFNNNILNILNPNGGLKKINFIKSFSVTLPKTIYKQKLISRININFNLYFIVIKMHELFLTQYNQT